MKCGGSVKIKVIANPVNTMTQGIQLPCTYIVSGKGTFVQDIKRQCFYDILIIEV